VAEETGSGEAPVDHSDPLRMGQKLVIDPLETREGDDDE